MTRFFPVLFSAMLAFSSIIVFSGPEIHAQPAIPKEKIPSDMPADVKKEVEKLYSQDPHERAGAVQALGKMGKQAAAAIPFLISILPDEGKECSHGGQMTPHHHVSPEEEAGKALVMMGDASVQPLMAAMKDKDIEIRRRVAKILGDLKDPRAVQSLAEALQDENPNVRMMAAWSLAQIGNPSVEPLLSVLNDPGAAARGDAAWALGKIKTPKAVEPLIQLLKNENPDLRRDAAKALQQVTGQDMGEDPAGWQSWWEKNKGSN